MEIKQLVRPNILKMEAYSSARDEYTGGEAVMLDANENPYPSEVNRYPDPYQRQVKDKLAEIKNLQVSQLFLGNGSDEAIDLLIRIFCSPGKDHILTTAPTYGMYKVSAATNDVEIVEVPLSEAFELDSQKVLTAVKKETKIIFLCSPNNPSGNLLDRSEIEHIIDNFNGIVVVDEAYIDFAKTPSITNLIDTYPNLVVLQTLSKAWGMAGVRLGMAIANEEIIGFLNKVKPPYNINSLTQTYVLEKLANADNVQKTITQLIAERDRLADSLKKLSIVSKVYPSDSNFLLVKFIEAERVFSFLLQEKLIVRNRTNVLHGTGCLRITIGTPRENDALLTALNQL